MANIELNFHEILHLNDDYLLPYLDLYEQSFPQGERLPVSSMLHIIKRKMAGEATPQHLWAALDSEGELVGSLTFYDDPVTHLTYLWYLAVVPERRSSGLGAEIFRFMQSQVAPHSRAIFFDVEIPEETDDEAERLLRARRIGFYYRLGARIMTGIWHSINPSPVKPPKPMHILVLLLQPMEMSELFESMKPMIDPDMFEQVGELGLLSADRQGLPASKAE